MERHLKTLATLQIAAGVLGILLSLVAALLFGGLVGVAVNSVEPGSEVAAPILGVIGAVVVTVTLATSIAAMIGGTGLLKSRPWAPTFAIVVSTLLLIYFPVGTVVGAYGLWALLAAPREHLFPAGADTSGTKPSLE